MRALNFEVGIIKMSRLSYNLNPHKGFEEARQACQSLNPSN